jgi:3-oxoacyl-[acyl-carrier-protein] synthase II
MSGERPVLLTYPTLIFHPSSFILMREVGKYMERVAITGIGVVTPIGIGKKAMWEGIKQGKSGIGAITRFDPSPFRTHIAAEVKDFDPAIVPGNAKKIRRFDRFSQFAMAAGAMALADAGLDPSDGKFPYCKDDFGVYVGTALAGAAFGEEQHTIYLTEGVRMVNPMLALSVFGGAASCNLAIEYGFTGANIVNNNSCASGTMAVGEAFRLIKSGEAKAMLAGGVEAPLAPLVFGSFAIIRAMSSKNDQPDTACRPFDAKRDGFVMAEGAAILVLENYAEAVKRNATIYAEVVGYGTTNDAFNMVAPLPDGKQAARSINLALREAAIMPEQIDYINAHASSTPLNDKTETLAIKQIFGESTPCVSGTKSLHGHALGATGAIEAAIIAMIYENGWIPATHNLLEIDPDCQVNHVPSEGCYHQVEHVVSNSFGFGGINAALAFKRAD